MNGRILLTVLTAAALAGPASAQNQRRANMIGGGSSDTGRCVAEVVVDGEAEVQVLGTTANVRNLKGSEPQWRRFDCTSPMPSNVDVRVNINGRGRGQLVASPRNGGPAVVRLEDEEGGASVYQLEFQWTGGGFMSQQDPYNGFPNNDPYSLGRDRDYRGRNRGTRGVSQDQALENCRQAIRQEARSRLGTDNVNFRQMNVDDQQGNRDLVVGTLSVNTGINEQTFPFSCSMNLNNGRVHQARINGIGQNNNANNNRYGYAGRDVQSREMDTCRTAVMNRIGTDRVEFGPMNVDDRNGEDLVRGVARANGRDYQYACSVSPFSGTVRNVDVRLR